MPDPSENQPLPKDRMRMMFGPTHDASDATGDAMIEMAIAIIFAMSEDQRRRFATRLAQLEHP